MFDPVLKVITDLSCMVTHQGSKAQNWVAAGVTIAVVVVLLIVAVVQCAVIWHMWR